MSVVSAAFTRFFFFPLSLSLSRPSVPLFISVFLLQLSSLGLPAYSGIPSALRVSYIKAKFSSAVHTSLQNAVACMARYL